MIDERERQIETCQTPQLGYIAFHTDAQRRMKVGERQVYCKTCKRWKWAHELCEYANYSYKEE